MEGAASAFAQSEAGQVVIPSGNLCTFNIPHGLVLKGLSKHFKPQLP